VQVKRMRQLHEQADELRTTLREWAGPAGADALVREPTNRAGRR
jgi:hypothetical protein